MKCNKIPQTRAIVIFFVGMDGDLLVREELVEKQDLRSANLGEDLPHGRVPVELPEQGAGGERGQQLGHVGEKVEWIPKEHRLKR